MLKFKSFITEAVKAEDYEAAIVMGFYSIQSKNFDPDAAGISKKVADALQGHPDVLESGRKIAEQILKKYPKLKGKKAEQFGRTTSKVTAFWSGHGASNPTPKTDILIGDMRFSLKIGAAQLMSGGKSESTATFYAALEKSEQGIKSDPQFLAVNTILEDFVTASLAPTQLRSIIKSKENDIVNRGEAAHKNIMSELDKLFNNNPKFKIEFAREAMSGFQKFGENNLAAAEYMLVATHDGSSVSIHSVYDDEYCAKIADRMKLQARFKTSSRKIKGKKTGEYNYWSVISLIVNAMNESYEGEGNMINEAGMFKKVKEKIASVFSRVFKSLKQNALKLLGFLGVVPEVRVKSTVNF